MELCELVFVYFCFRRGGWMDFEIGSREIEEEVEKVRRERERERERERFGNQTKKYRK